MSLKDKCKFKDFYKTLKLFSDDNGKRFYITPDNEVLPSVTTILSTTFEKKELEEWKKAVGPEKSDEIIDEARKIGSLVHKNIENYIKTGEYISGNNQIRKMAREMAQTLVSRFFYNIEEIWGLEIPLWYPGLYAGTTDIIFIKNNSLYVGDFKTTRKKKKEAQINDYKIQTVAYAMAHNKLYNTNIEKTNIFMISRDLEIQKWELEKNEFEIYKDQWLSILTKYYQK